MLGTEMKPLALRRVENHLQSLSRHKIIPRSTVWSRVAPDS